MKTITATGFDEWLRGFLNRTQYSAAQIAWWCECDHEVVSRFMNGVTATLKSGYIFSLIHNPHTPSTLRDAIRDVFFGAASPGEVDPDLNRDGRVDRDDLDEAHRRLRVAAMVAEAVAVAIAK